MENLKLLEAKLERFLAEHEKIRQERDRLNERLREREQQFAEMAGQLESYERERSELKVRLERILSRLEGLDLA